MQILLIVTHVLLTISLIVLILLQRGKGADIGAAFGSGASQTVFGSQGSASFLTRTTAVLATLFFITSLSLAYFSGQQVERKSVTESVMQANTPDVVEIPDVSPEGPADVPVVPAGTAENNDVPSADVSTAPAQEDQAAEVEN
ncbi:MAG: preprotein translocase subunit SecG [Gammaproteobacteria bacterium]